MTRMTGFIIFALNAMFTVPVLACDPAPNYSTVVVSSDAPSCLTINSYGDYSAFSIEVNNSCAYSVVVEPLDCVECDPPTEIAPGENRRVVVESTMSAEARSVAWLTDEDSGSIALELTYRDNSRACDGWDDDRFLGCQQTGSGNMLVGLLFILGWIGTRRLLAREA